MRIEIDPSAANDPDAHRWLDRILYRIEDGWHVWDTANPSDPGEMETTTWIRDPGRQGDWVRQLLRVSVQRSAWTPAPSLPERSAGTPPPNPPGRFLRVTTHPCTPDELTPENASRFADEPLYILVENRSSDGAFVKRVVEELDEFLHDLWKQPGEPIRIDSVGGKGQMPQEVERRGSGRPYRPRLVAIVDSDRKSPDTCASREARQLLRACKKWDLPCWILDKREAENYLPRVLLLARQNAGEDHKRQVDAWGRLSDDQKNFFDMKHGLPNPLPEVEQKLFDGLSQADKTILSNGFGTNVYKCWTIQSPSKEFTDELRKELALRGQGDLERGIELIRREV